MQMFDDPPDPPTEASLAISIVTSETVQPLPQKVRIARAAEVDRILDLTTYLPLKNPPNW